MIGLDIPTQSDIEDLALADTTIRHCLDVRIAVKCLTYEETLRMVDRLAKEKAWWRDRCSVHERTIVKRYRESPRSGVA